MSTDPWPKTPIVAGAVAVDALARRVTRRATDPDRTFLSANESWTPLPTWKFSGASSDDLTGVSRGLVTVIGPAAAPTRSSRQSRKGALWVVRCVCGVYSHRRTKSLKRKTGWDGCGNCSGKSAFRKTKP